MAIVPGTYPDRIIPNDNETLRERPFSKALLAKKIKGSAKHILEKTSKELQMIKSSGPVSEVELLFKESQNNRAILHHSNFVDLKEEDFIQFEADMETPEKGPGPYVIKDFGHFTWQKQPYILRPSEQHEGHYALSFFCYVFQNRIFRHGLFEKTLDFSLVHFNLLFKPVAFGYQTCYEANGLDLVTGQPKLEDDESGFYKNIDEMVNAEISQLQLDQYLAKNLKSGKLYAERLEDGTLYKHPKHIVSLLTLIKNKVSLTEYSKSLLDEDEVQYQASKKRAIDSLKKIEDHLEDYHLAMMTLVKDLSLQDAYSFESTLTKDPSSGPSSLKETDLSKQELSNDELSLVSLTRGYSEGHIKKSEAEKNANYLFLLERSEHELSPGMRSRTLPKKQLLGKKAVSFNLEELQQQRKKTEFDKDQDPVQNTPKNDDQEEDRANSPTYEAKERNERHNFTMQLETLYKDLKLENHPQHPLEFTTKGLPRSSSLPSDIDRMGLEAFKLMKDSQKLASTPVLVMRHSTLPSPASKN